VRFENSNAKLGVLGHTP